MALKQHPQSAIQESNYISRDLSWLQFNYRVLDQVGNNKRTIIEQLKFLAISASNFDEFFMIRVGSLYNYIDYGKKRIDYSGLREEPFRRELLAGCREHYEAQVNAFKDLSKDFDANGFRIASIDDLNEEEKEKTAEYFKQTIYPMLTPMAYDTFHSFPVLMNKILVFGVITSDQHYKKEQKLSFVQIPQNLPRFYEIDRGEMLYFVPVEEIIRWKINKLYRNVDIVSVDLFRITRNGDFTLEDNEDIEVSFIEEIKRKLKDRKTGRVVRVEVEQDYSPWMMKVLKDVWKIDDDNIFINGALIDFTGLWQVVGNAEFKDMHPRYPEAVPPLSYANEADEDLFDYLKKSDILIHRPYNSIETVVALLEKAAEDPYVLSIKITIYRLAKDSRVSAALLKAAENGKNVSVLFEVKARFDEENNIREAQRLQKAGCFVIYGVGMSKTHTKLMMIVRKEVEQVTRYVHMSSGNYNEDTAKLYTDIGMITTDEIYAHDVSEFFNVITGHSLPDVYKKLITAPGDMRQQVLDLIYQEKANAEQGLASGIVIKINSLEDKKTIDALYQASEAGVPIQLVVRGICCLRPGRPGLSENIEVRSVVGDFLEHSRLYYFHNNGDYKIYGGSADIMVRSFERRIESLFLISDEFLRQQAVNILVYNLKDNMNSYMMQEDGTYVKKQLREGEEPFNIHRESFYMTADEVWEAKLFS